MQSWNTHTAGITFIKIRAGIFAIYNVDDLNEVHPLGHIEQTN